MVARLTKMISISVRDLRRISAFGHIKTEVDLLDIKNDDLVAKYLAILAFDIEYPWAYLPSIHADLTGHIEMGFRIVGELSINRADINGPYCGLQERLIAAANTDISLLEELAELSGKTRMYATFSGTKGITQEHWQEDDHVAKTEIITILENLRDNVRGPLMAEDGSWKTMEEYKQWLDEGI